MLHIGSWLDELENLRFFVNKDIILWVINLNSNFVDYSFVLLYVLFVHYLFRFIIIFLLIQTVEQPTTNSVNKTKNYTDSRLLISFTH